MTASVGYQLLRLVMAQDLGVAEQLAEQQEEFKQPEELEQVEKQVIKKVIDLKTLKSLIFHNVEM